MFEQPRLQSIGTSHGLPSAVYDSVGDVLIVSGGVCIELPGCYIYVLLFVYNYGKTYGRYIICTSCQNHF